MCLKQIIMFKRKVRKMTVNELLTVTIFFCFLILIIHSFKDQDINDVGNVSNPTIMWWTSGFPFIPRTVKCSNNIKCDIIGDRPLKQSRDVEAYLFYGSVINFTDLPLPRKKSDLWGLFHEESPRNIVEFLHEKVLNLFNFSSTFSRHSDVPYPLQYLDAFEDITDTKYFVTTMEKNEYLKNVAPVLYLQSDCETSTERDAYVKKLMKFITIDSFGACLKNKVLPRKFIDDYVNNLNDDGFLQFVSKYKFVIAIENGVCEDYITEKLWRAIKIGSVPIYFGSPSIKDLLPNEKSAILLEDFPTPEELANHLKKLLKDDNLYEQYVEHKTKRLVTNKKLIDEVNKRPYQFEIINSASTFECYVCGKLHEKRRGQLGNYIVSKSHYDCPKPISALTFKVNPSNSWVYSWIEAGRKVDKIVKRVVDSTRI